MLSVRKKIKNDILKLYAFQIIYFPDPSGQTFMIHVCESIKTHNQTESVESDDMCRNSERVGDNSWRTSFTTESLTGRWFLTGVHLFTIHRKCMLQIGTPWIVHWRKVILNGARGENISEEGTTLPKSHTTACIISFSTLCF